MNLCTEEDFAFLKAAFEIYPVGVVDVRMIYLDEVPKAMKSDYNPAMNHYLGW